MSTKKIAFSTLWQLASQIAMAALSILTVKFVAIGLSKELAGNYNSAYGFLQLFGILADFGLYAVSVREVSKAKDKERVLGTLIVLRIITMTCSLGIALLFVWILPLWKGTPLPLSVTIASLVPFFTLLAGIIRTIFQVEYKMHYVFIAEVSQRIISVSLIGLFIALGVRQSTDISFLYLFLFFGGVGAFFLFVISIIYAVRLMSIRLYFDKKIMKHLIKACAPFGIAYLATALYREFDVTLIALLRPDYEIQNAYYGFVIRIMGMGFLIPTFLLNSTLPMLKQKDNPKLLGKTMLSVLVLGSLSSLFALLWARPIMQLLTTDAYLATPLSPGSDTALMMMSVPLLLTGCITYGFYVLLHLHAWRQLVTILCGGAGISLIMNIFLIPRYGFVGAATTSIVIHILLACSLLLYALHVYPISLSKNSLFQWALFSVLLCVLLWLMRPFLVSEIHTIIGLIIISFLIGILLRITGIFRSLWV